MMWDHQEHRLWTVTQVQMQVLKRWPAEVGEKKEKEGRVTHTQPNAQGLVRLLPNASSWDPHSLPSPIHLCFFTLILSRDAVYLNHNWAIPISWARCKTPLVIKAYFLPSHLSSMCHLSVKPSWIPSQTFTCSFWCSHCPICESPLEPTAPQRLSSFVSVLSWLQFLEF